MKRRLSILHTFLLLSCFAFFLSSCKTVNELPTQPSEQISQTETSEAAFSAPTQAQTETVNSSRDIGHIGLGIESGWSADDVSAYMDYTGGEMTLPIFLESSGRVQTVGIGILLFLAGKPQPYRLEGESEYTYLHIFYPTSDRIIENLYLTPVSGEVGESPDLYVMSLLRPDYYPSQGPANTMTYTGGSVVAGLRLNIKATPDQAVFPEAPVRLQNIQVTQEDCPYADVAGWSQDDFLQRNESRSSVDGHPGNGVNRIYGLTEESKVALHYELWGSDRLQCDYVIFVDNVPIASAEGIAIEAPVISGRKTLVDATLDMTGFTGESVIYAVRVPRSYYSSGGRMGYLQGESYFFLLAGEDPDK